MSTVRPSHALPPLTALTALAASLALLGATTASLAAPTAEELARIKLYGDVSIAQDSASVWGPWEEFEPTAAGPAAGTAALPRPGGDAYRPLAQTVPVNTTPQPTTPPVDTLGCAGGSFCGFSVFHERLSYGESPSERLQSADGERAFAQGEGGYHGKTVADRHPARVVANVITSNPGNALLPQAIEIITTPLSTGTPLFANTGTLTLLAGEGGADLVYARELGGQGGYIEAYQNTRAPLYYFDPAEIEATPFKMSVVAYMQREQAGAVEEGPIGESARQETSWGVIGRVTSEADMSNLRNSNAQATYLGSTNQFATGKDLNVNMRVHYGTSSWNMTVNGGVDGSGVRTATTSSGGTALRGPVGFEATGTINGVNFTSTSVSAADAASISGQVRGVAYGPNAAAIGGVIDITKTVAAPMQQPSAVRQVQEGRATYTDGRFTTPFLAVRDTLIKTTRD